MQMRTNRREQGTQHLAPLRSRLRVVTLSCFLIALLSMGATSAQAAFPGENGRIAVQRTTPCPGEFGDEQHQDIVIIAPDGSENIFFNQGCPPLGSQLPPNEQEPAYSSDGKKIVFSRTNVGGASGLWVVNADGSGEVQLTTNVNDVKPAFSPDGTQITFHSRGGRDGTGPYVMKTVPEGPGNAPVRVATGGYVPVWSPDGKKIAYSTGDDIYTVNADGSGGETQLTGNPPPTTGFESDTNPDWSPDGSKITFDRNKSGDWQVWSMNADGSSPTKLTEDNSGNYFPVISQFPVFSPDGTKIAFQKGGDFQGRGDLFVMNADGSGETNIAEGSFPDWQPIPRAAVVRPPAPRPPAANPPALSSTFAGCPVLTANVVRGTAASNTITATTGADRIFAGAGNDIVDALAGNDCVDLGAGADRGKGSSGVDLLRGGSGTDTLSGDSGKDRLFGGGGNDPLSGGSGNDSLSGNSGNDRVSGNSGNDIISGGSGNERISGGSGRDGISGGSGRDRISTAGDGARDRVNCGRGRDTVIAGRSDRVARNCERVIRRRR